MIVKPHIDTPELEQTIRWYTDNFASVHQLTCSHCRKLLALEVSGGPGLATDARGVAVIPVGPDLLSSRVRLDEGPDGPMVGYQCRCGNDTRLSEAEEHHPPQDGWYTNLMPHEEHTIRAAIKQCGHKADYSRRGAVRRFETFKLEAMK